MVCEKCEKKLEKLITPEVRKGDTKTPAIGKEGGRKIGGNMMVEKKKFKYDPYTSKCKICSAKIATYAHYCQKCSYVKGICSMCGKQILDVKMYKQTLV